MKRIILILVLIVLCVQIGLSQDLMQTHHKWVTYQGWLLVKNQNSYVNGTVMDYAMGNWWDLWLHGQPGFEGDWKIGKIMTGAWREDETDAAYKHTGPYTSATHFWDADCGDDCTWWPFPYTYGYANSYMKGRAYWFGNVGGNGWLEDGFYFFVPYLYMVRLKFNDLADVYKTDQIWVTHTKQLGSPNWYQLSSPVLFRDLLLEYGFSYNQVRTREEKICWEIVGRICHLIEDSGVPAHTHNDAHSNDYYEDVWMPNHYTERNSGHALQQGGLIDVSGQSLPLKYIFYPANQLGDRFPSNDEPGDNSYNPYYSNLIQSLYDQIQALGIGYQAFGENPPSGMMEAIRDFSYVYSIRAVAGFLKYVYDRFNIQSHPPPIISGFTQTPAVIRTTGTVRCNLSQGENVNFAWSVEYQPTYATVLFNTPENGVCTIILNYNATEKPTSTGTLAGEFKLNVTASNNYGSDFDYHIVNYSTNSGGCPWVFVTDVDSLLKADNNILHRSELPENQGIDIIDKLKFQTKPGIIDNIISIQVAEIGNDLSCFDQFKLYDVEHPEGTMIAITEDNEIVMFDSVTVLPTDNANLNGVDITENVQFHEPPKVSVFGDTLDHIYSHFEQRALFNAAIIMQTEGDHVTPTPLKSGDHLVIGTDAGNVNGYFSHRENPTITVMPVQSLGGSVIVNTADVDWTRNFNIRYIALTTYSTEGFTVNEMPLVEATHTVYGDVLSSLLYNDTMHVEMDTTGIIILKFYSDRMKMSGGTNIHDYIFETRGRYVKAGQGNIFNLPLHVVNKNNNPTQYKLYINYPNPFNPKTTIKYDIAKAGIVKIKVYDMLGRLVTTLVDDYRTQGSYNVLFDGSNLASGVYIYKLESGNFTDVKKMVLIK